MNDPQPEFQPNLGVAEPICAGLKRILAPNPSPMTFRGTNTYLVGEGADVAVIDPGPAIPAHLDAILAALGPGQKISHILVTHAHLDHSPLARPLAEKTGAPVLGFGKARDGRSAIMQRLAEGGGLGGGEGIDEDFEPDLVLRDGDTIEGDDWQITALHTPGHMANHLAFAWNGSLFSGDLVMGWATSMVSPPDGDLTDFMASLRRLAEKPWTRFFPGHGAPVEDPAKRIADLLAHRLAREASILAALSERDSTARELAGRIYVDTPPALLPAAARNVLSHLVDLTTRNAVKPVGELTHDTIFKAL